MQQTVGNGLFLPVRNQRVSEWAKCRHAGTLASTLSPVAAKAATAALEPATSGGDWYQPVARRQVCWCQGVLVPRGAGAEGRWCLTSASAIRQNAGTLAASLPPPAFLVAANATTAALEPATIRGYRYPRVPRLTSLTEAQCIPLELTRRNRRQRQI